MSQIFIIFLPFPPIANGNRIRTLELKNLGRLFNQLATAAEQLHKQLQEEKMAFA
jgi:hypothetical protein